MPVGYEQCDRHLKDLIGQGGGGSSSGGGSFIATPAFSKKVLTAQSGTVDLGINAFDRNFDVLIVFKNSVLLDPEYYSIISNSQIQATDNETWEAGTQFNFIALMNKRAPSALKQVCLKNFITITSNVDYIEVGIESFNASNDSIVLFKNGVYQEKDINYTMDDKRIYPKPAGQFLASTDEPVTFNWLIFRNVPDYASVTNMDGKYIKNNSISYSKLIGGDKVGNLSDLKTTAKTNAVAAINELKDNIGTISDLKTTDKTSTVGAINELFQYGVNLQTSAKSALDAAGISYSNDQLSTLIETMSNNLYTQIMHSNFVNKLNAVSGSTIANTSNTFDELIDMIKKIARNIDFNKLQYYSYGALGDIFTTSVKGDCIISKIPLDTIEFLYLTGNYIPGAIYLKNIGEIIIDYGNSGSEYTPIFNDYNNLVDFTKENGYLKFNKNIHFDGTNLPENAWIIYN